MVDKTTFTVNAANLTMRIQQAEMYLKEFENEVKRANGASGIFRSKEDALSRIMILNEFAPDDPRVKELFDRAVNAGLLKKDYQPAPGVERYQLKVIAIAINAIMKFSFRDKWCHFVEQWGEEINRCMVPLTKGAAINQIVRLYPEVPLWEKIIPENEGKTLRNDYSEEQAKKLFTGLMRKGYLGHHTSLESFLSILGMGQAPFTPINWIDRGYNSLIYFAKEAFGTLNPDILLRLCDCFTCNGKQINHSSLKSRSSYVYRNKDQWDFVPVIDGIIARARKK